ncbi:MAG: hypothetical protein OEZ13_01085 [Spirochaetia bacterium]|nr:hypothetical protein [Spirochaetia bacterium]
MKNQFNSAVKSYAKLNLGLLVPFKYKSGYHHIVSIFVPISFADEISFQSLEPEKFQLSYTDKLPFGYEASLNGVFSKADSKNNLIYKAYLFMNEAVNSINSYAVNSGDFRLPGIHVNIAKKIPSPGGLGGGSSNAASVILYYMKIINKLFTDKKSKDLFFQYIQKEALSLGSDIPFFLVKKPALVSGIGEIKETLELPKLTGILGVPRFGFSTPAMYSALKKTLQTENDLKTTLRKAENDLKKFVKKLRLGSGKDYTGKMPENEFIKAAQKVYPDKTEILIRAMKNLSLAVKESLEKAGIKRNIYTSMSGSGASIFSIIVTGSQEKKDLNKALKSAVTKIEASFPEISWMKFHSV